jgi:hypothetical protein
VNNPFGFGEPDKREAIDLNDFDEEVEVSKARKYTPGLKFSDGVANDFKLYNEEKQYGGFDSESE